MLSDIFEWMPLYTDKKVNDKKYYSVSKASPLQ